MKLALILLSIFVSVRCHMELRYPLPRKSKFDDTLRWDQKDYTNIFPIGNLYGQDRPFCHHTERSMTKQIINAGADINVRFSGEANHEGGHCEFSLSYDGVQYTVLKTIIGNCLEDLNSQYSINIPPKAPNGRAIFSWTWVNRRGQREFYQNCADIDIVGGPSSGSIKGPQMLIANLPGHPTIHQFIYSIKGVKNYRNRKVAEVGIDGSGRPYSRVYQCPNSRNLKDKAYFFSCESSIDPTEGYPDFGKDEDLDD